MGELVAAPGAKSQMVRSAIDTFVSGHTFSISELERLCPTVSRETVRRVLRDLREKGQVECLGHGPECAVVAFCELASQEFAQDRKRGYTNKRKAPALSLRHNMNK